jgi:predicted transcriptional regulator
MQLQSDIDTEASQVAAAASMPRKRNRSVTRKVTIRLTEKIHEQLEAATDRPGVGRSMVVEAALAQFMNPQTSAKNSVRESLDDIHARFDSLERELRTIAETVALHARYHLAVMPPLPQQQHREVCQLGDERFKVLAEQVDQRVRQGRPLIQETIDRVHAASFSKPESTNGEDAALVSEPAQIHQDASSRANVSIEQQLSAAAGEGGSKSNFRHLPNSFCGPA